MEIWKVHPKDPHYGKNAKLFCWRMMHIKFFLTLCATKDIYPEPHFDEVRWMLLSYLIRESFERNNLPMPQFANGKRLHASGCSKLYDEMVEKEDPAIEAWLELRKEKKGVSEMKRYLELHHIPQGKTGKSRRVAGLLENGILSQETTSRTRGGRRHSIEP